MDLKSNTPSPGCIPLGIVDVGFEVSGTRVLRGLGVPDGGAESDCWVVGEFVEPVVGWVFEAV
jgi:hypothetical protein